MRVLDVACGTGRHAAAAARNGAQVVAADRDPESLKAARDLANQHALRIDFHEVDLEGEWPAWGDFDVVLVFNYLDRARMPRILQAVRPGGLLLMETFLTTQRTQKTGPTSDDHLLAPGELCRLVERLTILHGREAAEPVDDADWRHVASVCARRPSA